MRTTIDLPNDLMRAAKARAAEHSESLKELFARAIAHEVRLSVGSQDSTRVALPLVGDTAGPKVDLTNADIEAVLAAEDGERYGTQ